MNATETVPHRVALYMMLLLLPPIDESKEIEQHSSIKVKVKWLDRDIGLDACSCFCELFYKIRSNAAPIQSKKCKRADLEEHLLYTSNSMYANVTFYDEQKNKYRMRLKLTHIRTFQ